MPEEKDLKSNASGKKCLLSCCKCFFEQIGANLAHIQAENVQKMIECVFVKKPQVLIRFTQRDSQSLEFFTRLL